MGIKTRREYVLMNPYGKCKTSVMDAYDYCKKCGRRIGAHGIRESYRCGLIKYNKNAPYNNLQIIYNEKNKKYEYVKENLPFLDELIENVKEKKNRELREWLVETYNSTLPQKKYYDEEFDEYITVAEGGIYDGEWELYVFDDCPSPRIKEILSWFEEKKTDDDMKTSQQKRQKIFLENKDELEKMRDVKKGTRYRKWLYNRLLWLSQTVFDTEEEEYQAIQKFPRGMWCKYDTTFKTKKEEKFMIEIAKGFGAFDY